MQLPLKWWIKEGQEKPTIALKPIWQIVNTSTTPNTEAMKPVESRDYDRVVKGNKK